MKNEMTKEEKKDFETFKRSTPGIFDWHDKHIGKVIGYKLTQTGAIDYYLYRDFNGVWNAYVAYNYIRLKLTFLQRLWKNIRKVLHV